MPNVKVSNECCKIAEGVEHKPVDDIEQALRKAEELYRSGQFLCSEAVFVVANEFLGRPVSDEIVRLASGFPVGMGTAGCACGALTGGVMALGLKYGRTQPGAATPGMFEAARELHDRFIARRAHVCCRQLIRHFQFGSPEHLEQCIAITGEVAADVVEILARS
ncbi:MAG TPA: C-GCAxxG-C-C family protein [Armatimonadota bacterium]|nr:C-GCAxxG-C-C family protein [Armatimonadota bacterium]